MSRLGSSIITYEIQGRVFGVRVGDEMMSWLVWGEKFYILVSFFNWGVVEGTLGTV